MLHVLVLMDSHQAHILVLDDGPEGPKHVSFIDDTNKSLLCLTVLHMPMLTHQHGRMNSLKIFLL